MFMMRMGFAAFLTGYFSVVADDHGSKAWAWAWALTECVVRSLVKRKS